MRVLAFALIGACLLLKFCYETEHSRTNMEAAALHEAWCQVTEQHLGVGLEATLRTAERLVYVNQSLNSGSQPHKLAAFCNTYKDVVTNLQEVVGLFIVVAKKYQHECRKPLSDDTLRQVVTLRKLLQGTGDATRTVLATCASTEI